MSLPFRYAALAGLYGGAWRLARPFLRRVSRLKDGFDERLAPAGWAEPCDLWIQSASAGESYLAAEMLPHLKAPLKSPQAGPLRVLLTTCTRQGLDVLSQARQALADNPALSPAVRYFPLDQPGIMERALAMAQPRVIVLLETELWPGLLFAAAKRRIPVVVVNGRMSAKSLSGYRKLGGFWPHVAPARVAAISEEDARRFDRLFYREDVPVRSSILLNIKFDRALRASSGIAQDTPILPGPLAEQAMRVLFASVREEEEEALAPVLRHIHERKPGVSLLVAPRHMHRVAAWRALLEREGIPPVLRSGLQGPPPPGAAVLWDAFGELNALYAASHIAFVGGSLAPLGGQNFLEPLAHGSIPLVGPHLKNFAWIGPTLEARGLVRKVADATDLERELFAAIEAFQADAPAFMQKREETRRLFAAWARERIGGSAQAAALALSVAFPVGTFHH